MAAYQAHETAVIDPGCTIGDDTFIWHFSHIMAGCIIGEECNIGRKCTLFRRAWFWGITSKSRIMFPFIPE